MNPAGRKRLEAAGWKVGTEVEFLGLTPEESTLIDMQLALLYRLRVQRRKKRLSQSELSRRLGASRSCVARIESGALMPTLDLLIRALLTAGATRAEVGRAIASRPRRTAA